MDDSFWGSSLSDSAMSSSLNNTPNNTNPSTNYTMAEQMEGFLEFDERVSEDKRMMVARPNTPTSKWHSPRAFVEGGATENNGEASDRVAQSPTQASQETLSPTTFSTRSLSKTELQKRDLNAIAYSKSLLNEGDTMVFISYPGNSTLYDPTGFPLISKTHLVHSQKLLATGSKFFKNELGDWRQHRLRKRKGYQNGLPGGIKYILDLTPPDEGDEAVDLTSELSCSLGIRHWYSAESRCCVAHNLVGGKDEVTKPVFFPGDGPAFVDPHNDCGCAPTPEKASPAEANISSASSLREEIADIALKQTMEISKREFFAASRANGQADPDARERYLQVEEVLEYCQIRHRAGIERLLQVIEGKDPRLDSAPKVWTLFVLSKYFDCTEFALDWVTTWLLAEPNCQFIEILPEASLRIGLGLQSATITRPAFAILVSEEALSIAARRLNKFDADKANTNQFLRAKEYIDEDALNSVQHAAQDFHDRVCKAFTNLTDPDMAWLEQLPEFQKIREFGAWVTTLRNCDEEETMAKHVTELIDHLRKFVRGRILCCHASRLSLPQQKEGNDHRRAEQYLRPFDADFGLIYDTLTDSEQVLTKFFWRNLRGLEWSLMCPTSIHGTHGGNSSDTSSYSYQQTRQKVNQYGIEPIMMKDLAAFRDIFNKTIIGAVEHHNYRGGQLPNEALYRQVTYNHQPSDTLDEYGEEIRGITEDWETADHITPWARRDDGSAKVAGEHEKGPAAMNFGFEFPMRSKVPMESQEKSSIKSTSGESSGSINSAKAVLNYGFEAEMPLRPKLSEQVPLLEKMREGPSEVSEQSIRSFMEETKELFRKRLTKTIEDADVNKLTTVKGVNENMHPDKTFTGDSIQFFNGLEPKKDGVSYFNKSAPHPIPPKPSPQLNRFASRLPVDRDISAKSPCFSLGLFFSQINDHINGLCGQMLWVPQELDWAVLTDTLLCLTDEENKYLPLWAGGNEDGSGGVYDAIIPPAATGAGPSGPGPAYHTGFTINSAASTEADFDDESTIAGTEKTFNTSVAVENGYSEHIDRRLVMSDDGFYSETFSDDNEDYTWKGKAKAVDTPVTGNSTAMNINDGEAEAVDAIMSGFSTPKGSNVDEDFDFSEEEEDFNFGDDDVAEEDEGKMDV